MTSRRRRRRRASVCVRPRRRSTQLDRFIVTGTPASRPDLRAPNGDDISPRRAGERPVDRTTAQCGRAGPGPSCRRGRRLIIVDLMTTDRGSTQLLRSARPGMPLMNGITEQRQANQTGPDRQTAIQPHRPTDGRYARRATPFARCRATP